MLIRSFVALLCVVLAGEGTGQAPVRDLHPSDLQRSKVRTITAFVRLDRSSYQTQVEDALKMLRAAKKEFANAGYEVETIRITSQPFPEYIQGLTDEQVLEFFRQYDQLAQREGFIAAIGPAMINDAGDPRRANLLAQILSATQSINGFLEVANEKGIHHSAIRAAAGVIKYLEEHTSHSEGNFRFAAGAFPPASTPFFPVSSTQGAGHEFAIGLESANLAARALAEANQDMDAARIRLSDALSVDAKRVETIARAIEKQSGWTYEGIDLTPVPLGDVSIGAAIESVVGGPVGSPGTLHAAYTITSAVRGVAVKQTGYSGLMLPVLEDGVLAKRWEQGTFSRDALLSYSAVCSTGLDAVPLPGDISERDLENIIADVASLAYKWHKPLAARLLPVSGKKAGEMTQFTSPYLVNIHIRWQ